MEPMEALAENTLILRPKTNLVGFKKLAVYVGFLLLMFVFVALYVWAIWVDCHPELGLWLLSWSYTLIMTWFLLLLLFAIIGSRYGLGDLILSPEGFEIRSLRRKSPYKYRWADVTGFYVAMVPYRRYESQKCYEAVCFDKTGWGTRARQEVFPFQRHPMSNTDMAALMNEWKQKYAPNPEGITFNPVTDPPPTVSFRGIWYLLFHNIWLFLLIALCQYLLGL